MHIMARSVMGMSCSSRSSEVGSAQCRSSKTNTTGRVYYVEFGPDGSITSPANLNPGKIAVSTAILQPTAVPKFNNKDAVRGVILRKTGAVAMVNEATGF